MGETDNLTSPGVDFAQERFMGQGPQDNESAVEQAKDEAISDFIRDKYVVGRLEYVFGRH